jgi:hypothetical protein
MRRRVNSHSRLFKKVDAILTEIRQRLGEPEPEPKPIDPEMKTTLDELEKTWNAQRPSQAKNTNSQNRLDRARAAAVVCKVEAADYITSDISDSTSQRESTSRFLSRMRTAKWRFEILRS